MGFAGRKSDFLNIGFKKYADFFITAIVLDFQLHNNPFRNSSNLVPCGPCGVVICLFVINVQHDTKHKQLIKHQATN